MGWWQKRSWRWRRFIRFWLAATFRSAISPLDASVGLGGIAAGFGLYSLYLSEGVFAVALDLWGKWLSALGYLWPFVIYLCLVGIVSLFRVRSEEAKLGAWTGNRFVYHSPLPVKSLVVTAADNGREIPLSISDAEVGSLVELRASHDRRDNRLKMTILPPGMTVQPGFPIGKMRLPKDRKLSLYVWVAPDAASTNVRVSLHSFEVGAGVL